MEDLGDDAAADLAQSVACITRRRLQEYVEPERRRALPAVGSEAELVLGQQIGTDQLGDRLA